MTDSSRTRKKGAGALPMAETRSEYARLMRQGISNAVACRMLKINRRTGMRWCHGRIVKNARGRETTYAPISMIAPTVISPRYLSEDERVHIADGLQAGTSLRQIPRRWDVALRRSAVKCAAIVPRAQSATLPALPNRSPTLPGNALDQARSPHVRLCAMRSRNC